MQLFNSFLLELKVKIATEVAEKNLLKEQLDNERVSTRNSTHDVDLLSRS